jgi:hypothetical protein
LLVQGFDADLTSILPDQNSGPGLAANAIPKDPITTLLEKLRTCSNQLSQIDKDFDCFRDQFSDELRRYIASQQISSDPHVRQPQNSRKHLDRFGCHATKMLLGK